MTAFWKKKCTKNKFLVFIVSQKGAFFGVLVYFGNVPNFAGLWCPNRLTHRNSWVIIGKIISVAFIWYLVVLCVTASLVTIASLKSGLILSSLKLLISVLSNKAVLDSVHVLKRPTWWAELPRAWPAFGLWLLFYISSGHYSFTLLQPPTRLPPFHIILSHYPNFQIWNDVSDWSSN